MVRGWPDWMFAAFAIGGWELFDFLARKLHDAAMRWIGGGIVALCALVLLVRYIYRWWYRRRHPEEEDPDAWKHY
ncbi:hypothetical protein [Alicyclobacillus contaminans]|uniref:hypothetical protein n=1 Tax=Alicyclobacillus contaminans TaxID=392016 RepID=UPI00041708F3|nr:hypothetical protein [Alicyclobacillus contaminans]